MSPRPLCLKSTGNITFGLSDFSQKESSSLNDTFLKWKFDTTSIHSAFSLFVARSQPF